MPEFAPHYDSVIVGAGSAGCVLANRLSADPQRQILLVEAGPSNNHLYINMPAAVPRAIASSKLNWHYWTTPQKHLAGRALTTPRGKVLGGSSSINALVYVRGHAQDYDRWRDQGCEGWGYQDVLPYFKAIEANARGEDQFRGTSGELYVGDPESNNPMFKAFVEAGQQMGYPHRADFNGAQQDGFGFYQLNIKDGRRMSAASAFLDDIRTRSNLQVTTGVRVLGLCFDGQRNTGLVVRTGGQMHEIRADKTILSAGAIGTPQLLLCSGIGPAGELTSLDIQPQLNLPGVGKNLQDHLEVKVKCRNNQPVSLGKYAEFPRSYLAGLQYLLFGSGVCRQQGLEAGAFVSLDTPSDTPDIQLHFINALAFDGSKPEDRGHGFAIDVTQLHPESRGQLTLKSKDPEVAPNIDPNYLAESCDRTMMREGLKFLRELCAQPALAQYVDTELFPGTGVQTDAEIDDVVRRTAESIYHPVGTAKMGHDSMSVVDPSTMAVHGADGLYVADASVMPDLVSGNTHAASVMIGAKAADLIS